jgi:hypothetical protein
MKIELMLLIFVFFISGVMAFDSYVDNGGVVQYLNDSGNLTTANAVYYVNGSLNGTINVMAYNISLLGSGSIERVNCIGYSLNISNVSVGVFNFSNSKINIIDNYGEVFFDLVNSSSNNLSSEIIFRNNSVHISSSFNYSARVILKGIGARFTRPLIYAGSNFCSSCVNLTSLNAENVIFNVSGFGNYSIGENTSAIDSINPEISFVSPTDSDGSLKINRDIKINVSASDSNLVSLTINVYDNIGIVSSSTSSSSTNYISLIDLSPGRYRFNATAVDSYGNRANTETRTVVLNGTSTITNVNSSNYFKIVVYEPKATKYNANLIKINFSATDSSGISSKWYSNGSMNFSYSNPVSINLPNGDYTFRFYATNGLGVVNYTIVQFIINSPTIISSINTNQSIQVVQSNTSKQPITLSNTKEVMDISLTGNNGFMIVAGILALVIAFEAWILRKRRIEYGY